MDRRVFTAVLLVLAVVALIYLAVKIFAPFLVAFLWAAVLATVTYGTYRKIVKRLRGRRTLASLYMTTLVFLLIILPVVFLLVVFVHQASGVADWVSEDKVQSAVQDLEQVPVVKSLLDIAEKAMGEKVSLLEGVKKLAATFTPMKAAQTAASAATDVLAFVFAFLADLFFMLLSVFYLYRDGPSLVRFFRELMPLHRQDTNEILHELGAAVRAAVIGGLLTAAVQGFLGFVILFVLGLPSPVFWSFVMALASLIPIVGTALVWVPMAGILLLQGDTVPGISLLVYGTTVIGLSDNFLRPIFVGRSIEVHTMLLFFGILGGIAVFGFAGLVMGPVVVAFLVVTSRLFRREFREAPQPVG